MRQFFQHTLRSGKFRVIFTPLLILFYWQLIASSGLISAYLLPSPLAVSKSFIHLCASGILFEHIASSLWRVSAGFMISCILGIVIAAITHHSRLMSQLLEAPLSLLRMTPPLAMIPLLILWLGIGNTTQLTIIILAAFFPIFMNASEGLKRVTLEQKELAQSLHLSAWRYFRYIIFPAAIPSIVTGARLSFGYSWRALVGAELIAASSGLGYLIQDAQDMQRTDVVIVGIIVIGMIGWFIDALFAWTVQHTLGRRFAQLAKNESCTC